MTRRLSRLLFGLCALLAASQPLRAAEPNEVLTFLLIEYADQPRTGYLHVFSAAGTSPYMSDATLSHLAAPYTVRTDFSASGTTCDATFRPAGSQQGWLLGPTTDLSLIREYHNTATAAYGVLTPTGGSSYYNQCGTQVAVADQASTLLVFVLPQAVLDPNNNLYQVADLWYGTGSTADAWYAMYPIWSAP